MITVIVFVIIIANNDAHSWMSIVCTHLSQRYFIIKVGKGTFFNFPEE